MNPTDAIKRVRDVWPTIARRFESSQQRQPLLPIAVALVAGVLLHHFLEDVSGKYRRLAGVIPVTVIVLSVTWAGWNSIAL